MQDAYRRAETFEVSKSPYGLPSYPYVWHVAREHNSLRLEMGKTEKTLVGDSRRIVAMFTFQVNGPPAGVGVLAHVAVWLIPEDGEPDADGWTARHSANTNYHLSAISCFKGALLNVPGVAYAILVPENPPPPPKDEELPPPPPPPSN